MKISTPQRTDQFSRIARAAKFSVIALLMGTVLGTGFAFVAHAQSRPSLMKPHGFMDLFSEGLEGDPQKVRPFIEKLDTALDNGADIEDADEYGNTPLLNATYWASWTVSDWGANDVVAFLLARGANPNRGHIHMGNMTPLDVAAHSLWPNVKLVDLLCAAGADANNRIMVPQQTISLQDGPITIMGFPQVRDAIEACAQKK